MTALKNSKRELSNISRLWFPQSNRDVTILYDVTVKTGKPPIYDFTILRGIPQSQGNHCSCSRIVQKTNILLRLYDLQDFTVKIKLYNVSVIGIE